MLRGSNTTISIAHRLSTIQRSDVIIVIGADGKIAQTGRYKDLAAMKDGAFAKLMEWQLSGAAPERNKDVDPELTEEERRKLRLEERDREQARDELAAKEEAEVREALTVEQKK